MPFDEEELPSSYAGQASILDARLAARFPLILWMPSIAPPTRSAAMIPARLIDFLGFALRVCVAVEVLEAETG